MIKMRKVCWGMRSMSIKQSENDSNVLRQLGIKPMTGIRFEKLKGEHTFSEDYQKQKAYVLSELNQPVRRTNRYVWQVVFRICMAIFFVGACVYGTIYVLDRVHQVMLTGEDKKERQTFADHTVQLDTAEDLWEQIKHCDYVSLGDVFYEDSLAIRVDRAEVVDTVGRYQSRYFKQELVQDILDENGALNQDYRFIYVTVTVKNEGTVKVTDYLVNEMCYWVLKKQGGSYEHVRISQCTNKPVYFDASMEDADRKGFFRLGDILPDEEITYHIGYFIPKGVKEEIWLSVPESEKTTGKYTFVEIK